MPTVFTWGYYGWGNHMPQLGEAVDAVERSRGFESPLFADIRVRRMGQYYDARVIQVVVRHQEWPG